MKFSLASKRILYFICTIIGSFILSPYLSYLVTRYILFLEDTHYFYWLLFIPFCLLFIAIILFLDYKYFRKKIDNFFVKRSITLLLILLVTVITHVSIFQYQKICQNKNKQEQINLNTNR